MINSYDKNKIKPAQINHAKDLLERFYCSMQFVGRH